MTILKGFKTVKTQFLEVEKRPIGGFFELVMRGSLQKIEYSMCRHDHLDPNKAQEYTPDCVFFDAVTD